MPILFLYVGPEEQAREGDGDPTFLVGPDVVRLPVGCDGQLHAIGDCEPRAGLFAGVAGIAVAASGSVTPTQAPSAVETPASSVDPIRSSSDRHIDESISEPQSDVVAMESGYVPEQVVTTADELEAILGEQFESQVNKVIDHIDDHCRAWIERSPFVVVTTWSAMGAMDVSPKVDPPGLVRVLDPKTLAVPDRPWNHRGDTFRNVLEIHTSA